MKGKSVIVIGAGAAGLTAALTLAENQFDVNIIEADNQVGGLARSFDLWGQRVDCGPHRFISNHPTVNNFFKRIIGEDYISVNRLTRIYYKNRFFTYPLRFGNVLRNMRLWEVSEILFSYAKQSINPVKSPETLEEWVTSQYGSKFYQIFFKNYSEKLWGIPCGKIDADWASQRIKKLSLFEAVRDAVAGKGGSKHKTLAEKFAYPKFGSGMLYERMAHQFEQAGGKLELGVRVKKIVRDEEGKVAGIELMNGSFKSSDIVISTMPLTLLVNGMDTVPDSVRHACDSLYFRNTILVYVEIDSPALFLDNWIYINSPEILHGRVTNFRNWSPNLYNDKNSTILCLEYWCFNHDPIWEKGSEYMGQLATNELRKLNLINHKDRVLNTHMLRIPKCYPVYEIGYRQHVNTIKNYLDTIPNLLVIGRYGSFKYNNQDHSILMGLLAARQIISGQGQNLWNINSDDEYQEEISFDKTGL